MQCETFSIVRRALLIEDRFMAASLDNDELVLLLLVSLISTPTDAVPWAADLMVRCPNG